MFHGYDQINLPVWCEDGIPVPIRLFNEMLMLFDKHFFMRYDAGEIINRRTSSG